MYVGTLYIDISYMLMSIRVYHIFAFTLSFIQPIAFP